MVKSDLISWTVLGSSSGEVSLERNCSGHILNYNGRLCLFDCGSGVASSFRRSGFESSDLSAVIISHTHPDHISDLPFFIQMLYLEEKRDWLDIYLPSEAVLPVRNYLNACYLFKEKLPFELTLIPVNESIELPDIGLTVNSISNAHLRSNAELITDSGYPNQMKSYSFEIITGSDRRIFYSADLASIQEIEDFLGDLDLLVIETTHVDINRIIDLKSRFKINKVLLSHISDENYRNIAKFIDQTSNKGLIMAEDNLTIDL
jgi:ribonuclease BN (tRNA processing enzyme)